mmetsp:Transcript_14260/g.17530  ORF Transcript_14260/g.17530 Transcript_14260/m.17530 type:complete len:229 (-) Transcript_14260:59-745(-)
METETRTDALNTELNEGESQIDGTQTSSEPKKYCGIFSKTGLILTVVIIITVIAVAVTVPTVLYYKNRWKKFEDSANDSTQIIDETKVNWNTNQVGGGFSSNGFVVGGIDFVQYSLNGVPKPAIGAKDGNGNFIYTTTYLAGQFAFVSQENLDIFLTDPARYAPRYGGYCAWAMSRDYYFSSDPGAWTIYLNELYMNASPGVRNTWDNDIPGNIQRGDNNWAKRGFSN